MWHTSIGERVLKGAEGRLVHASLRSVLRTIDEHSDEFDDSPLFGVPLFDELEQTQRLVLLAQIGAALFREDVPPMQLTAVVEATVHLLYQNVMDEIEHEIELQCEFGEAPRLRRWRRMVLAACREAGMVAPHGERFDDVQEWIEPPNVDCTDLLAWQDEVTALSDLVFHDHDWQMADELLDQPPEVAQQLKAHLGIDDLLHGGDALAERVRRRQSRKTSESAGWALRFEFLKCA
jgi:hypothetical protein